MKIVIIGNGKVGFKLTAQLSAEDYDVTLIDQNADNLKDAVNTFDILCVTGNAADVEIQKQAGVPEADMVIACTSSDEINMLSCLIAKRLGAKHTVARVRNPVYYNQISVLKEDLRLSMAINPELAAANEIANMLLLPEASRAESFMKGRVQLVEFVLKKNDVLVGMSLADFYKKYQIKVLICAVKRGNEVYIPRGNFVLEEGDRYYLAAAQEELNKFFKAAGYTKKIRKVLICGGGLAAYYLTKKLLSSKIQVKIIENDMKKCELMCEHYPAATIIHGDATDQSILEEEGIEDADAVVALTGLDEQNIIMALYGRTLDKDMKTVAKVNDDGRSAMVEEMGIDYVVSAKQTTADTIMQYIRARYNSIDNDAMEACYKLLGGKVEASEFNLKKAGSYTGIPLRNLKLKPNHLIACIGRDGKVIIPNGNDTLEVGDNVVVVAKESALKAFKDIFA